MSATPRFWCGKRSISGRHKSRAFASGNFQNRRLRKTIPYPQTLGCLVLQNTQMQYDRAVYHPSSPPNTGVIIFSKFFSHGFHFTGKCPGLFLPNTRILPAGAITQSKKNCPPRDPGEAAPHLLHNRYYAHNHQRGHFPAQNPVKVLHPHSLSVASSREADHQTRCRHLHKQNPTGPRHLFTTPV